MDEQSKEFRSILKSTRKLIEDTKTELATTRTSLLGIETSISEIKKDGKKNSRLFWIPLISVVVGGFFTFSATYYFQLQQAAKDRKILVQQLYGELNYNSNKYIHAWHAYYSNLIEWEYSTYFGNPSTKQQEMLQTSEGRCQYYLDIMDETECQIEKNYSLLNSYIPINKTTDSLKYELFFYQDFWVHDIRNTSYDTIQTYGRGQFDNWLREDYQIGLKPRMELFLAEVAKLSPEINSVTYPE